MIGWISDPGHGWLKVPLSELNGFIPSEYSYRDDEFAYLEEDCDAFGWADHCNGLPLDGFPEIAYTNEDSFVRKLSRFHGFV